MRTKSLYFLTYLFFKILPVSGQITFLNMYQAPLLQNPSNAGSKEQNRISTVYNNYQDKNIFHKALYIGYDKFLINKKIGLGVYFFNSNLKTKNTENGYIKNFLEISEKLKKDENLVKKYYKSAICLSPKYNLGVLDSKGDFKYTFSPSLEIGYGFINKNSIEGTKQTFTKVIYNDTTQVLKDSVFTNENVINYHQLITSIGLKFSSSKWMIMYAYQFTNEYTRENYKHLSGSLLSNSISYTSYDLKNKFHSQTHKLSGIYSFSSNRDANINMIIVAAIEYNKIIGLKQSERSKYPLINNEFMKDNFYCYYISTYFRFKKVLSGISFNQLYDHSIYGLSIGLQNPSYRALLLYIPQTNFNSFKTIDLSLVFYI